MSENLTNAKSQPKIEFLSKTKALKYLPIVQEMLPYIKTKKRFKSILEEMSKNPNQYFLGIEENGQPVAFCDFSISYQLWDEKICYINHLIINKDYRGGGLGTKMLDFVIQYADKQECEGLELRSELFRKKAHTFYYKKGFYIDCFNFRKDVNVSKLRKIKPT